MAVTFPDVKMCLPSPRILLCALLGIAPLAGSAAAVNEPSGTTRIIIGWHDLADAGATTGTIHPRFQSLAGRSGRALARGWNIGGAWSVLQFEQPIAHRDLPGTLAALRADPRVQFAVAD